MSNSQYTIINKLLEIAESSKQNTKVAAAICSGKKILSININTHRNKYNDEIRCSGHAEIACIHSIFPNAFKNQYKKGYV